MFLILEGRKLYFSNGTVVPNEFYSIFYTSFFTRIRIAFIKRVLREPLEYYFNRVSSKNIYIIWV